LWAIATRNGFYVYIDETIKLRAASIFFTRGLNADPVSGDSVVASKKGAAVWSSSEAVWLQRCLGEAHAASGVGAARKELGKRRGLGFCRRDKDSSQFIVRFIARPR